MSASAGGPLWNELVARLAGDAGCSDDEIGRLRSFPAADAASIIEGRVAHGAGDRPLGRMVRELGDLGFPGLAHAFLAALPVREYVTTNDDQLLERPAAGVGRPLAVIPYAPDTTDRWLLEMHGCVSDAETIVLTREDYLRHDHQRAALARIVQALLITRHMLFLGFSLTDENFHRIADAVRRALAGRAPRPCGTALMLSDERMLAELWRGDLALLPVTAGSDAEASRRLEIVLDCVLAHAHTTSDHLLDPRFDAILSPGERQLEAALQALGGLPPEVQAKPARAEIEALLLRLGRTGGPRA